MYPKWQLEIRFGPAQPQLVLSNNFFYSFGGNKFDENFIESYSWIVMVLLRLFKNIQSFHGIQTMLLMCRDLNWSNLGQQFIAIENKKNKLGLSTTSTKGFRVSSHFLILSEHPPYPTTQRSPNRAQIDSKWPQKGNKSKSQKTRNLTKWKLSLYISKPQKHISGLT